MSDTDRFYVADYAAETVRTMTRAEIRDLARSSNPASFDAMTAWYETGSPERVGLPHEKAEERVIAEFLDPTVPNFLGHGRDMGYGISRDPAEFLVKCRLFTDDLLKSGRSLINSDVDRAAAIKYEAEALDLDDVLYKAGGSQNAETIEDVAKWNYVHLWNRAFISWSACIYEREKTERPELTEKQARSEFLRRHLGEYRYNTRILGIGEPKLKAGFMAVNFEEGTVSYMDRAAILEAAQAQSNRWIDFGTQVRCFKAKNAPGVTDPALEVARRMLNPYSLWFTQYNLAEQTRGIFLTDRPNMVAQAASVAGPELLEKAQAFLKEGFGTERANDWTHAAQELMAGRGGIPDRGIYAQFARLIHKNWETYERTQTRLAKLEEDDPLSRNPDFVKAMKAVESREAEKSQISAEKKTGHRTIHH